MATWLDYQHDTYKADLPRWGYVRNHYTGEVLNPKRIAQYLIRKATAETEPAYLERCNLADYTPHFATIVDSLAGMLFQNEQDKGEKWNDDNGQGLGERTDPDTPLGRLWADADGMGTGYTTLWKQLTTELVLTHTHWVLVDSLDGEPVIRLIPPESVTNWVWGPAGLTDVLVCEETDTRTSLEQEPKTVTRYVRYTPTGWQRYEKRANAEPGGPKTEEAVALPGKENSGTYVYLDRRGRKALPIFRITLPLARPVGYIVARKANAIFNKESERDHLLRFANFPKLCLDVTDDTAYDNLIAKTAAGFNILPGARHVYIAPDTGPATIATDVLKRKVEELYITAFREYGDAAQQKTATEIRQDVSAGVGAFLQLLKAAVDDAENEALWRVEQTLFADQARWFVAHVERSDKFMPSDINEEVDRLRKWAFGEQANLPIGRTAQIALAKETASFLGQQPDDAELESAVDLANLKNGLDVLVGAGLPLPAEARAELGMRLIAALGIKVTQGMLEEAKRTAANEDERKRQEADFFRGGQREIPPGGEDEGKGNKPPIAEAA